MKNMKLLSKAELRKIIGAVEEFGGKCNIKYTSSSTTLPIYMPQNFSGNCVDQQVQAQIYCINLLASQNLSGDHCYYDCACDGSNPNF